VEPEDLGYLQFSQDHHHVPGETLDLLQRAFRNGQSGLMVPLFGSTQQVLLASAGAPEQAAQCWQVTVLAMQEQIPPTAPTPATNSVNVKTRNRVQTLYNTVPFVLCVQFGTGNVTETAFLDYPFGGGTFELRASSVRVYMLTLQFQGQPAAFGRAQGGAFISPGSSRAKSRMAPTFTSGLQSFTNGGAGSVWCFNAPERAVGYRVYMSDAVSTSSVTVQQGTYTGVAPFLQTDFVNADMRKQPQGVMPYEDWIALNEAATAITLTNNEAAARTMGVVWVLDLG